MTITNPNPMHPGKVLSEVYMSEMGLNPAQLASKLGCTDSVVNEIIDGKKGMTAEFAIGLERELGTTAQMWVRMQAEYDLGVARRSSRG